MSEKRRGGGDERRDAHRQGSVAPKDAELTDWLAALWARKEHPQRIEVRQWIRQARGELVFHWDTKGNDPLDIERVTKLSNEIIAACQHDCDVAEKKRAYVLDVIDNFKSSDRLVRGIGPLQPERNFLKKVGPHGGGGGEDGDDEDQLPGMRTLMERYTQQSFDQIKWDKQRYDLVMGQLLTIQSNIIDRQQQTVDTMQQRLMTFFERLQESEDRRLDRDIRRQKEELKAAIFKDLVKMARNLIPGMVASSRDGAPALPDGDEDEPSKQALPGGAPRKDFGPSPERALVDNILDDCEEAKIDVDLFGTLKEEGGRIVVEKAGIFSLKQLALLQGVRTGQFPPDKLDALLMDSGDPLAVTPEQLAAALTVMGDKESLMLAFRELFNMRTNAREKAAAAKQAQATEAR